MDYPTFKNVEEMREMMDRAESWGFKQMGRHRVMSPYRYIILAAVRRELTIIQLTSIIDDIKKLYEQC